MMENGKFGNVILHVLLDDNEHTRWLSKKLAERRDGFVTVVDPKHEGIEIEDDVTFTNLNVVLPSFELSDKVYWYAYMERKQ